MVKIVKRGMVLWVKSSSAVCPYCHYEYSKIDYKGLSKGCEAFSKQTGFEPSVDWFLELLEDRDAFNYSMNLYYDKEPYLVACLNCRHWLLYDEEADGLSLTKFKGEEFGVFRC